VPLEGEVLDKLMGLIDRILTINRTADSLKALRDQATIDNPNLKMEKGLLLYQERLMVLNINNLQMELIHKAHC
jgi:hypothetical protein